MQGVNDDIEGIISGTKASAMNSQLISNDDKQNDDSIKYTKNLSFLDDGPILITKLPKQILDLYKISIPNIISVLGVAYFIFMNMLFAQRLGDETIVAAYGMGATWYSITTYYIQVSICNGLFIQLAHAFGAKQFKIMQELFQRCIGILCLFGILCSILMLKTKSILIWFGIEEKISTLTEVYAISCIPAIFGSVFYDTSRQMLMAQNNFDIPMKTGLIIYFIHPLWLFLFTDIFKFGIAGIGIARGISFWLGFLTLSFYINYKKIIQKAWNFEYNLKIIFSQWIPFLKIAIPVGSLDMLEWIFFEVLTVLIAKLNNQSMLAGQSSFQGLVFFFFITPLGVCWTTSSYLGNAVGEGKKQLCQQFAKLIMIQCAILVAIFIIIGQLLKQFFYDIFTVNDEMGQYYLFAYNFYIYGFIIGDFFQFTLNGILKCCDKQNFAALSYFIVYYIFGLPLAMYLTFTLELEQAGVWITQTLVAGIVSIIFYIKIIKIDWDEAINLVKLRNQKEQEIIEYQMQVLDNN